MGDFFLKDSLCNIFRCERGRNGSLSNKFYFYMAENGPGDLRRPTPALHALKSGHNSPQAVFDQAERYTSPSIGGCLKVMSKGVIEHIRIKTVNFVRKPAILFPAIEKDSCKFAIFILKNI